jgi:hypothetical protein
MGTIDQIAFIKSSIQSITLSKIGSSFLIVWSMAFSQFWVHKLRSLSFGALIARLYSSCVSLITLVLLTDK